MTSYPKNVQFTNLKVNSEQDLFLIDPTVITDNVILNEICANECIPPLDLIPPCNQLLAALKVKGSASICKGLNIGNTDVKISGTIRFNGKNFEGFNGIEWIRLDCCEEPVDEHLDVLVAESLCSGQDHVSITPDSDLSSNASISIGPNPGGGFLSAQKPTPGSIVGGECRGIRSVDFQQLRTLSVRVASGNKSFIGSGEDNTAFSDNTFIGAGDNNAALSTNAAIVGGGSNIINEDADRSFIGGGINNAISTSSASTEASRSCIMGGGSNKIASKNGVSSDFSTIGGGFDNTIGDTDNTATDFSFIGGGQRNEINGVCNTICGGCGGTTDFEISTVVGGSGNHAGATGVFIGGGENNRSFSAFDVITGGQNNLTLVDHSTITGGEGNVCATGSHATVCGGFNNKSTGTGSHSRGEFALADREGQASLSSGRFSVNGDAQNFVIVMRATTTGTENVKFGYGISGNETLVMPEDGGWIIDVNAIAKQEDLGGGVTASTWTGKIGVTKDATGVVPFPGAGALTKVNGPVGISGDITYGATGASGFELGFTAEATEAGGTVDRWVMTLNITQVLF